jgi:hypothetical protein
MVEDARMTDDAPALLRVLWADPEHMPEHLVLWSLRRMGPRAARNVEQLRRTHPDASAAELDRLVIERQTAVTTVEGAFVGGPFIVLIPVAFCAALLAEAQLALELAATAGHSPTDERRAADLLVIQGAYDTTNEATAALARVTRDPGARTEKRLPRGSRWSMVMRMAFILGVLGAPGDPKRSRLRATLGWVGVGVVVVVGLVLPLVWVPYMAVSMRKSAVRMGDRARKFYADRETVDRIDVPLVRLAFSAGLARFLALFVLLVAPLVVAVVGAATGVELGTGRYLSAVILLVLVSGAATLAWIFLARRRRGRREATPQPLAG